MDEAREMHRLGTESDSDIPIEAAQFMEAHRIILADAIRQDRA